MRVEDVLRCLSTDRYKGLSERAATRRLGIGNNRLWIIELPAGFPTVLKSLLDYTTVLFAVSVGLTALFGSGTDAWILFALLLVSLTLRACICWTSRKVLLKSMEHKTPRCRVMRGGKCRNVFAHQIAEGDIILLAPGDTLPCDVRLIAGNVLVSETYYAKDRRSIEKRADAVLTKDAVWSERSNILFAASTVLDGECVGVAIAVGERTYAYATGGYIRVTDGVPVESLARIRCWSRNLSLSMILVCGLLLIASMFVPAEYVVLDQFFLSALSLTVASMSEFMPVAGIAFLCCSMHMLQAKTGGECVVKTLGAAETAAVADTVVFSDESLFQTGAVSVHSVMDRKGSFRQISPSDSLPAEAEYVLSVVEMCEMGHKGLSSGSNRKLYSESHRLAESLRHAYPSDGTVKLQGRCVEATVYNSLYTAHVVEDNRTYAYICGSLESVLPCCSRIQADDGAETLTPEVRSGLRARIHDARIHNRKTIAIAKRVSPYPDLSMPAAVQSNMTLIGCITVDDPIGEDIPAWVSWCRESGVRLIIFCEDQLRARQSLENAGVIGESDAACVYSHDRLEEVFTTESAGNLLIQISPKDRGSALDTLRKLSNSLYITDRLTDLPCIKPGDSIVVDRNDASRVAAGARRTDAVIYQNSDKAHTGVPGAGRVFQMISHCKYALSNIRCAVIYLLTIQVFRLILVAMTLLTDLPILAPGTILLFGCVVDFLTVMLIAFRKPRDNPSPMPLGAVRLPGWSDGLLAALGIGILCGLLVTSVTFMLWRFSWVFDRNAIMHLGLFSVLFLSAVTLYTSVAGGRFGGRGKSRASAVYVAYVCIVILTLTLLVYACIGRYSVTEVHVWLLTLLPSCVAFLMQKLYHKP